MYENIERYCDLKKKKCNLEEGRKNYDNFFFKPNKVIEIRTNNSL